MMLADFILNFWCKSSKEWPYMNSGIANIVEESLLDWWGDVIKLGN